MIRIDEQSLHARGHGQRRTRRRRRASAAARGHAQLHDPRRIRAAEGGARHVGGDRTSRAGHDRRLGREQRRSLREWRLPLRQEAAARDRSPDPLPRPPPRPGGGRGSGRTARRRDVGTRILRRDRDGAIERRQRAHARHRRHRRDRHVARLHQLDLADGARLAAGPRGGCRHVADPRRQSRSWRSSRSPIGRLRPAIRRGIDVHGRGMDARAILWTPPQPLL